MSLAWSFAVNAEGISLTPAHFFGFSDIKGSMLMGMESRRLHRIPTTWVRLSDALGVVTRRLASRQKMTGNTPPIFAPLDGTDGLQPNAISLGNGTQGTLIEEDGHSLIGSQFAAAMMFPARNDRPALAVHIGIIVGARSHKQVSRINAKTNVALMANDKTIRNFRMVGLP